MRVASLFLPFIFAREVLLVAGDGVVEIGVNAPPSDIMGIPLHLLPDDARPTFESVSSANTEDGPIEFSMPLSHRRVTNSRDGGWYGWGHGYSGDVYWTGTGGTSVTLTLPICTRAFVFYVELNAVVSATFTITYTSGMVKVDELTAEDVANGSSSENLAYGFGIYSADPSWGAVQTVVVDAPQAINGFAVGEFYLDDGAGTCDGGGYGDPHFQTWAGTWYDFHGICDQILATSPSFADGLGLDIHIRTKPRFQYSYIEATAIRIGNDVLQVGSWGEYWLNGVESVGLPTTMANKYKVTRVLHNKKHHNFVIDLGGTESIVINVFKDLVNVQVQNATSANFGTSSGLMGSFPNGVMLARDGAAIVEDTNLFGQEWQVMADDPQLFLSPNQNQHAPGVCTPPVHAEGRRLGEAIQMEAAEKACSHHKEQHKKDMCIFDVMAMADLEMAEIHGAY